jgi:stage V sporulation protein AC
MQIGKEQYKELYTAAMPRSRVGRDSVTAFCVGGFICALGQLIMNLFLMIYGMTRETASLLMSLTLIAAAAVLTGLGLYDKISRHAGAGTLVPITGFSNSVVAPALEFKSEGFILGTGAKMFVIAGPVLVYGTAASVAAGIIMLILK